jgi:type I restriction-modification system DNA methylase subunit
LIREIFINDDVIEAIISLPPGLFYGIGIPACALVCNKNKPDSKTDKVYGSSIDLGRVISGANYARPPS